jgi:hypothetical protein
MNLNTVAKSPNAYEFLELPNTSIQLDLPAIDDFLRSHGVKLTHYRAIRCPVGLTDRDDVNASHEDHADCSNGYLYTKAGDMSCFFLGQLTTTRMERYRQTNGRHGSSQLPPCL